MRKKNPQLAGQITGSWNFFFWKVLLLGKRPIHVIHLQRCYSHKWSQYRYCPSAWTWPLLSTYPFKFLGHNEATWCFCWLLFVVWKQIQQLLPSILRNQQRKAILAALRICSTARRAPLLYRTRIIGPLMDIGKQFGTLLSFSRQQRSLLSCFW